MTNPNTNNMEFDMPKDTPSIIKVLGVGGGGSNAVNHMHSQGIKGVDFIICNTDNQALDASAIEYKIQLGASLTEGMGAGSIPDVGRNAAIETIDMIKSELSKNTKMLFITAGMGGGTGTGAAPIIAEAARELGILTVGIVTKPFFFEGRKRREQAEKGIEEIRQSVDTLLIINNDKLREMYGNLKMGEAFAQADNVLATAAKGIAEIITRTGHVNVDFEDVKTVMSESGVAIMGSATAEGENRAVVAVERALASPLLNDNDIKGARYVLLNMEFGNEEISMDEIADITDFIQDEAGQTADIIWGYGNDETLEDNLRVTIIATGFQSQQEGAPAVATNIQARPQKTVLTLEDEAPSAPANEPVNVSVAPTEPTAAPEPFLKQEEEPNQVQGSIDFGNNPTADFTINEAPAPQDAVSDFEPYIKPTPAQPETTQPLNTQPLNTQPLHEMPAEPEIKKVEVNEPQMSTPTVENTFEPAQPAAPNVASQQEKAEERLKRLSELSSRLRTPTGISDLENEPAYKRRKINLDNVPHSSDSSISRFTLSEEEDAEGGKKTELRSNNSFLHDNVD